MERRWQIRISLSGQIGKWKAVAEHLKLRVLRFEKINPWHHISFLYLNNEIQVKLSNLVFVFRIRACQVGYSSLSFSVLWSAGLWIGTLLQRVKVVCFQCNYHWKLLWGINYEGQILGMKLIAFFPLLKL